jgi:hypothetical protein
MRRKVQDLTISYPPPGPFSIDCPDLIKKDAVFRGTPLWEIYFPFKQLHDFLKGLAIQAGIVQFNADKTILTEGQANVEAAALPEEDVRRDVEYRFNVLLASFADEPEAMDYFKSQWGDKIGERPFNCSCHALEFSLVNLM